MNAVAEFISRYTAASRALIDFAWNEKHAEDFHDSNQDFRWQVVGLCIDQTAYASPLLLEHLFLADAEWAAQAWGSPHHFAQLGTALLERGQEASLDSFAKGFVRSFDTFGACHEMRLSEALLARLTASAKGSLALENDEQNRNRMVAVIELFEKLANGSATHGWAKVAPGTPVSNIKVVWPRWYHKLWAKLSALWSRRAT